MQLETSTVYTCNYIFNYCVEGFKPVFCNAMNFIATLKIRQTVYFQTSNFWNSYIFLDAAFLWMVGQPR